MKTIAQKQSSIILRRTSLALAVASMTLAAPSLRAESTNSIPTVKAAFGKITDTNLVSEVSMELGLANQFLASGSTNLWREQVETTAKISVGARTFLDTNMVNLEAAILNSIGETNEAFKVINDANVERAGISNACRTIGYMLGSTCVVAIAGFGLALREAEKKGAKKE